MIWRPLDSQASQSVVMTRKLLVGYLRNGSYEELEWDESISVVFLFNTCIQPAGVPFACFEESILILVLTECIT